MESSSSSRHLSLSELQEGATAEILEIEKISDDAPLLLANGLLTKATVTVHSVSRLHNMISIQLGGRLIGLRLRDAQKILVKTT